MSVNTGAAFSAVFSGGQAKRSPAHELVLGDPEVNRLWKAYSNPSVDKNSWLFRKQVFDAFKRLTGNGPGDWFSSQDRNAELQGYSYDFLLDTLGFIATGHRRISIYTWPDYLSFQPEVAPADVDLRNKLARLYRESAMQRDLDYQLQRWVNQPKGFDDLMWSLNIMFGNYSQKIKAE